MWKINYISFIWVMFGFHLYDCLLAGPRNWSLVGLAGLIILYFLKLTQSESSIIWPRRGGWLNQYDCPPSYVSGGYLELTKHKFSFLDWVKNKLWKKENILKISFPFPHRKNIGNLHCQAVVLGNAFIHLDWGILKILYKSWPICLSLIQKKLSCLKKKS